MAPKPVSARRGWQDTFVMVGIFSRSCGAAKVVGLGRFELPTSRLSSARSNQLSYKPKILKQGRTGRRPFGSFGTGSSAKKEKRRRRGPAKGMTDPETGLPECS
jgi:hypothetical protein